jgi:hypothetical protein
VEFVYELSGSKNGHAQPGLHQSAIVNFSLLLFIEQYAWVFEKVRIIVYSNPSPISGDNDSEKMLSILALPFMLNFFKQSCQIIEDQNDA